MDEYRLKMNDDDVIARIRENLLQTINKYDRNIRILIQKLEYLISTEKWEIYDKNFHQHELYMSQLRNRLAKIA